MVREMPLRAPYEKLTAGRVSACAALPIVEQE